MHKRQNKFGIRCLVAMLSGAMVLTSYAAPRVIASSYQNQIDDAKDKKQELEQKQKELKQKIQNLESKKGDILDYIEELDKELETLTDQITELNKEIKSVNEKLEETKINLEKATEKEKSQYETMKKRIQYMYENGETSIVEVLLSSENIADLLNQVEYVSEITSYDNSLLERYEETKRQVEEMKVSLEKSLEEKNLLSDELSMNQDALEEMMENKQTELKKYEANINESESLVSEVNAQIAEQENMIEDLLEKERKRIEEEERKRKEEEERKRREEEERRKREEEEKRQQQLQQQQQQNNQSSNNSSSNNSSSNTTVSSGGFLWPVPSSGRITCGFGYRESPTAGASTYHQGIDIGAPTGANIVATKAGTVVTASYNRGAGNYVMIHHGDGVYSVYMHCSKLLVSVGQSVSRGEVIALVGSTGFSTGPHLHFALSVGGTYVNPRKYVNP